MCAIAALEVIGSDEYGNATLLIAGDLPVELEGAVTWAGGQVRGPRK